MASVQRTFTALLLAYAFLATNGEIFNARLNKKDEKITKGSKQEKNARITGFENRMRELHSSSDSWGGSWSDSSSSKYKYKGKKSKKSKKSKKKKSKKHWHSSWGRPPWWSSSSSWHGSPSSSWHRPPSCQPWEKDCNPPGPSPTPPSVFPPSYFPPPRPTFPTAPFPTFPFPNPAPAPAPQPAPSPIPPSPVPPSPTPPTQDCLDPKDCPRPPRPFDLVN